VVVNKQVVVQGRLRLDRLDPADSRPADEAMEPGPTVRADADLAETTERMRRRSVTSLIVSNPDGALLGVVHDEPEQPQRPKCPNRRSRHESAPIVVRTFGKDDFLDLEALARVIEIPGGDAPSPAEAEPRSVCHLNAASSQDSSSRVNRTLWSLM
jgi:hypothetical protein